MNSIISIAANAVVANAKVQASVAAGGKADAKAAKAAQKVQPVAAGQGSQVVAKNAAGDTLELSSAAQAKVVVKADKVAAEAPVPVQPAKEVVAPKEVAVAKQAAPAKAEVEVAGSRQPLVEKVEKAAEKLQSALSSLLDALHGDTAQPVKSEPQPAQPVASQPASSQPVAKQPAVAAPSAAPVKAAPATAPQPTLPIEPSAPVKAPIKTVAPAQPATQPAAKPQIVYVAVPTSAGNDNQSAALQSQLKNLSKRYEKLENRFTRVVKNISLAIEHSALPNARDVAAAGRLAKVGAIFAQRVAHDRSDLTANLLGRLVEAFSSARFSVQSRGPSNVASRLSADYGSLLADEANGQLLDLSA